MAVLKILKDTVLKQNPSVQSSQLSAAQKQSVLAGQEFVLQNYGEKAKGHIQVTLAQPGLKGQLTWYAFADHVQILDHPVQSLTQTSDRPFYPQFFAQAKQEYDSTTEALAFLDRGVERSPFQADICRYAERLQLKPNEKAFCAATYQSKAQFSPYPALGKIPAIDDRALDFLDSAIERACLCLGKFVDGQLLTCWLGKNALNNTQFWSATKLVGALNVLCQMNQKYPKLKLEDCQLVGADQAISFADALAEIVSYKNNISNEVAATFKRFESLAGLEQWFRNLTGNQALQFQGYYGNDQGHPHLYIAHPQLTCKGQTLLSPRCPTIELQTETMQNFVSAYDLTRLTSMVGWHYHLPPSARLPGAQGHSLKTVTQAMGYDTARYLDAAIAMLGLSPAIVGPVILSKLGYGVSSARQRTEITYTSFVQFVDRDLNAPGNPAQLLSFSLTLQGACQKSPSDPVSEGIELDAVMATAVTEILRRIREGYWS